MPHNSLLHVHSVLLQMIRQDFTITIPKKSDKEPERGHVWEIRHAGLLGIKYEVAVRSDLFESEVLKKEDESSTLYGRQMLEDVVDAAILGYSIWFLCI